MASNSGPQQFHALERTARSYLEAPHTLPQVPSLEGWFVQLYLWHFPSFTAHHSWAIYQRRETGNPLPLTLLRQTTWDYAADAARFATPLTTLAQGSQPLHPTMETQDRPLDSAEFEQRMSSLADISFPAFCRHGLGLDGEAFGLGFPDRSITVRWWCEGPPSWQLLTKWAEEARGWLGTVAGVPVNFSVLSKASFRPRLP